MAGEGLSDDYVAKMLKEDAQEAAKRRALGFGYFPKRPTANAPKPNTRFLGTLLRETDSHNQALLAKEAEESRARLRALRHGEAKDRRGHRSSPREEHSRRNGQNERQRDSPEDSHSAKRQRVDIIAHDRNRLSPPRESKRHMSDQESSPERSHRRDRKRQRHDESEEEYKRSSRHSYRRQRRRREEYSDREDDRYDGAKDTDRHHRRRRHRSRSHSPEHGSEDERRKAKRSSKHHNSRRDRDVTENSSEAEHQLKERSDRRRRRRDDSYSRSRSLSRSRSPRREERKEPKKRRRGSPIAEKASRNGVSRYIARARLPTAAKHSNGRKRASSPDSGSDPLENIVGPLPPKPVRMRGRGAFSASAIDSRFAENYDPKTDVALDSDEVDEWGEKVEAFRDRQHFKQQQGNRLRAAGFTEEQVKNWEKGGEKTEEDVVWAGKGEGREWDRGKVVDSDGDVDIKAEWGRLKDT